MLRRTALASVSTVAALALSLGAAAPATAATHHHATRPSVAATRVVTRATIHQLYVAVAQDSQLRGWKRSEWRIQRIQVSSSGTWARLTVHPTDGRTTDATVLLRKRNGVWRSVDFGTAQVGCGIAPSRVLTQLHLGGC